MNFNKKINAEYLLGFIFVFSFAFDFKGDVGGSSVQYLMAIINMIAFLLIGIRHRFIFRKKNSLILAGWSLFLLTGSLGAFNSGVLFSQYIRTIYPFILFLEGFLVAQWLSKDSFAIFRLINAMIFSSEVSLIFVFVWGFYFTGLSLEKIRYQILSPLIPFLIVVLGIDIFITRKTTFKTFFLSFLVLGIMTISATRGILLAIGLIIFLVLAAWLINNVTTPKIIIPRRWLQGGIAITLMVTIGISLVWLFSPFLVEKFINRLFGEANMVTFWFRTAAVVGQWEQLREQPIAWFLGEGFGQSFFWSKIYIPHVLPFTSPTGLEIGFFTAKGFPGEFMWMSFLYYGGFLSGGLVIMILLWRTMYSFRTLIALIRRKVWHSTTNRYVWISTLGFFVFLAQGITANPFIIRQAALWFGILFGLTIVDWNFGNLSKKHI